jgi:hypothetical protein
MPTLARAGKMSEVRERWMKGRRKEEAAAAENSKDRF